MSSGAELFARFAYPPNALGYCGPDGGSSLLAHRAAGSDEPGFLETARAFEGAWPYLELLATALGVADPLDANVVKAYWIGGPALEGVGAATFGSWITERFGGQPGVDWTLVHALIAAGAVPHHSFHVLAIYPWLGLLRARKLGRPLEVLDRCRIRWGTVTGVEGDTAIVRCRPLAWDGRALLLGEPRDERVDATIEGHTTVPGLASGVRVAMHWDWICGSLTEEQVEALRAATLRHLDLVNATASEG